MLPLLNYVRIFFVLILTAICCTGTQSVYANSGRSADTTPHSTAEQALLFLKNQTGLEQSRYWPNVDPAQFLRNLTHSVQEPLSLYEGKSTNFCAYAAISYLPLHDDPLRYVSFMLKIYKEGKAVYGKEYFEPSKQIKLAAGTLTFKGELDVRPADQLWFMLLADHFKGYVNFFDKNYNSGDENTTWASVNFAKYNRMIRNLFNYQVNAVGSDLLRPGIRDMYEYLSEKLKTGTVGLFVNNPNLYKKNHAIIRIIIPTHFITLLGIEETEDDQIAITYWDYGFRTRQIVTQDFLKKIIFGVIHITKKTGNGR